MKAGNFRHETETVRIGRATEPGGILSSYARDALEKTGGAGLLEDWARILFIHFAVDPAALQPQIPFRLDVREGLAYVSLTAFYGHGLRPSALGGSLGRALALPGQFPFILNVRTYVRHGTEDGIHFLAEWIPNRLAAMIGRSLFGLPFHTGRIAFEHTEQHARGRVCDDHGAGVLAYEADWDPRAAFAPTPPCSLAEWLLERYTAFTRLGARSRFFRVWHPAWPQTPAIVRIADDSLLRSTGPWYAAARLIGGNYSPGFFDVRMGRAQPLPTGAFFATPVAMATL